MVAGAGAPDLNVALTARDHALAGLEFLSGIPGTIGGAFPTNAGAYGGELKDVLVSAEAVDRRGTVRTADRRPSLVSPIATAARRPTGSSPRRACARRPAISSPSPGASPRSMPRARESQPRSRTGGSTFANPPGHKAWELIDRAGCRGLTLGDAQVSEKHTNFLINTGDATADRHRGAGRGSAPPRVRDKRRDAANGKSAASGDEGDEQAWQS